MPDIDLKPTEEMAANAARGLELREKHGRGGTAVGVARARDISNRKNLSPDTVRRMNSYFARHAVDKQGEGWGKDSAGYIAWLLWGGDAGRAWAKRKSRELENKQENAMSEIGKQIAERLGAVARFQEVSDFQVGDKVWVLSSSGGLRDKGRIIAKDGTKAVIAAAQGNIRASTKSLKLIERGTIEDLKRAGFRFAKEKFASDVDILIEQARKMHGSGRAKAEADKNKPNAHTIGGVAGMASSTIHFMDSFVRQLKAASRRSDKAEAAKARDALKEVQAMLKYWWDLYNKVTASRPGAKEEMSKATDALEYIKASIANGKTVYVQAGSRTTKITPKTYAKWEESGRPLFKMSSDGALLMANGSSYVRLTLADQMLARVSAMSRPGAKSTNAIREGEKVSAGEDAVSRKIALLMREGYPQDQAVAIALDMKRRGEL